MSELKPIAFTALAAKEHEDKIGCIEGVLASLYPAKTGTKNGKEWSLQDGVLKDGGHEHKVCFAAGQDVSALKGKRIRITSHVGEKGMSGVYMKQDTYTAQNGPNKGKEVTTRKIHVTATANIEVVGSNGQPAATPSQTKSNDSPRQTSNQSAGDSSRDATQSTDMNDSPYHYNSTDPVEVRVAKRIDVFEEVCRQLGRDPEKEYANLSPDKLMEFTTGICMSFHGQYGVYQPPFFANGIDPDVLQKQDALLGKSREVTKELEQGGETVSPKPSTSGKAATWRDFEYKGEPLGSMDEEHLSSLVNWCHDKDPQKTGKALSESATALRSQLLMADAELRTSASKKVSSGLAKLEMGDGFDEEEVNEVCEQEFGAEFSELHYGQLVALGNNLQEYVAKMRSLWQAKQTPKKKSVRPPAKAAAVEEDDDMPS